MAKVPLETVPDVQVISTPPSDYQSIPSSPADFGGLIGQGQKEFAGDLSKVSQDTGQIAQIQQERYNRITGDDAMNKFMDRGERLTYGTPGDSTEQGLYNLKGSDALRRGPEVVTSLRDLREQIKGGLQNDAQKIAFDEASRRYFQYKSSEISRHLSSQADVYGQAVNHATMNLAGMHAANAYNSDDAIMSAMSEGQGAAVRNAQLRYGDSPDKSITETAQIEARTKVVKDAVDAAIAAGDQTRAKQIVTKFGGLIDPVVGKSLFATTKSAADQAAVGDAVRGVMAGPRTSGSETSPEEHEKNVNRAIQNAPAAKIVHDGLVQRGMDSDDAWAFAGNGVQESSLNPKNIGDNGFARGLFMWRTDEKSGARAQDFKQIYGHLPNEGTLDEQLDFVMHELKGKENGAWQSIQSAQGIDNKARLVSTAYLRPKDTEQEEPRRATIATTLASAAGGGGGGQVSMPPSVAHNPEPFGWEQQRMDSARQQARQRFPDDPKLQKQVIDGVWEEIQRTNLLQAKYDAQAKQARMDAQNKIMGDVVTAAHKDPASFDPSVLDAKDQAGNYVLEYKEREQAYTYLKHQLQENGVDDIAPFGKGYTQAYNDILDGKLTDTGDLLRRGSPGGDLSSAGVQKLHNLLVMSKKDMNFHGQAEVERGMLNHAKKSLLFPGAVDSSIALPTSLRDSVGEDIYNSKFLPAFYWGLNQAIATGKPEEVRKFLTKENVDKIWQPLRSQSEMALARLHATGESFPGDVDKPDAPLPPVPKLMGPARAPTPEENLNRNKAFVTAGPHAYSTALAAPEEEKFRQWVSENKVPFDPNAKTPDYDMRGFWKTSQDPAAWKRLQDAGKIPADMEPSGTKIDPNDGKPHYPDYWKTPYHQTFSNESQWATPNAPHWTADDKLVGPDGRIVFDDKNKPMEPIKINPEAWTNIMNSHLPMTNEGHPFSHKAWADVLGILMQNPEKNIEYFDRKFGPAGYDGAAIVKRLRQEQQGHGETFPATPWDETGPR